MNSMMGYGGQTGRGERGAGPGEYVPKGYRKGQISQFTPEQMQLFQQLFGLVGQDSYLSKLAGGDEEAFQQTEAPALRQFSELLGGLGSRFSGMGMGARRSSGFQNTASSAASNFAQELASQRQSLQRQAIMDLMGISQSLLGQRPMENLITPKSGKKSFLQELGLSAIPGFSQGLGRSFGGF